MGSLVMDVSDRELLAQFVDERGVDRVVHHLTHLSQPAPRALTSHGYEGTHFPEMIVACILWC
jgi:hypothetical protein